MPKQGEQIQSIDIIHVLMKSTHAIQREFETRLATLQLPYLVSGPRLRLLAVVSEAGQIRMNELAAELGIKPRTVTDFVDGLEQDRLLIRVSDPKDRRATLIELTDLAKENLDRVLAFQAEIAKDVLAGLTEDQRKTFFDLLLVLKESCDTSKISPDVMK